MQREDLAIASGQHRPFGPFTAKRGANDFTEMFRDWRAGGDVHATRNRLFSEMVPGPAGCLLQIRPERQGSMSLTTFLLLFIALAITLALAVGLAYVPMRLLIGRMARDIRQYIKRQRDRRRVERGTPDRRSP
jgi:hypothetical protein